MKSRLPAVAGIRFKLTQPWKKNYILMFVQSVILFTPASRRLSIPVAASTSSAKNTVNNSDHYCVNTGSELQKTPFKGRFFYVQDVRYVPGGRTPGGTKPDFQSIDYSFPCLPCLKEASLE